MAYPYSEEAERFAIKSSDGTRTYLEMPIQHMTITGLAMPPLEHRTIRSPFQHGATFLGFSLRPRVVQVALHTRACTRYDMWLLRRSLIDLINPLAGTLRFVAEFRNGDIFELLNVVYDAGFEVGTDGQPEPAVQRIGARFIAYDPVWYLFPQQSDGPVLTVVDNLIFGDTAPPSTMVFPITFGDVHINDTVNITTGGNWQSYPTIVLTGPLNNVLITNETTGETLQLQYSIADGEVVMITTEFGNKTVTNQNGVNLLGYLLPGSDLATFHLDPNPIAAGGVNAITFFATGATIESAIAVQWYDRYLGL